MLCHRSPLNTFNLNLTDVNGILAVQCCGQVQGLVTELSCRCTGRLTPTKLHYCGVRSNPPDSLSGIQPNSESTYARRHRATLAWYSCSILQCRFIACLNGLASVYLSEMCVPATHNQDFISGCHSKVKKVKADRALHGNPISELRDVTCHMGPGTTQRYLSPDSSERAPPNPSHAGCQVGTRFTYPEGMEGWVDLVDLIAPRPGVEPAIFRSRVRRRTAAPPRQRSRHSAIQCSIVKSSTYDACSFSFSGPSVGNNLII